ncbi:MAG: ABC transporter ATP-binding protein [Deltaproteobacteria bacterium]|nr:ABC transporter ATP-binding protein [Deltaproteobacteria bacterium]MBW2123492.1 ABC transporter ATP-binding protein [Deltaproteobacteria bacterium]
MGGKEDRKDSPREVVASKASAIEIRGLTKEFGSVVAVANISLEIKEGEFITLLGPSGSGKTTTLMMIAGFLFPTAGDIRIGTESILSRPVHKRNLGIVFQNYSLFPHMTVYDNIAFPLKMRRLAPGDIERRVKGFLELVKLSGFEERYPKQLSGGQQQRVALARALVFDPPIVLMDEPLGALDKNLREAMQLEIKDIQERLRITTIYVTHDQSEALTMSDRIVVMNNGSIEQVGSAEELYESPANRFVAGFIGESNFLEGQVTGRDGDSLEVTSDRGITFNTVARGFEAGMGKRVCTVLRPEKLTFLAGGETPRGWNMVEGIIEEEIYLGEIRRYKVKTVEGQVLSLKISNMTGIEHHRRGDRVRVGWRWTDGIVVE